MPPRRRPTSTSNFGAGRRESHDATAFYERFTAPTTSSDTTVNPCSAVGRIITGDSRDMSAVESSSVALVVTSPPYFAGKEYEEALGEGHIPASYFDYLAMLRDVFAECVRVLEPGGRIAVNVANLGRRPYRSLAGDVTMILQDELGLLLRGEVVWIKAEGATGSTAWGSFQSAANPVLRDLSERIVIASKGRFDRAPTRAKREKQGLPFENTISKQEFMQGMLDIWRIQPESARRVGHPAPFPVAIPARCIELFTFRDDVVLDPFMGSGSTAVAAVRAYRQYVGYDTDPAYVALAEKRVAEAQELVDTEADGAPAGDPDGGTGASGP
jgi:site-specific DNA-methyltransferase (adenine-specific)